MGGTQLPPAPQASPTLEAPSRGVEQHSQVPPEPLTLRHPGWMISLQMEHSMSMRLNLPSSSSTVSSFPASPHTRHTAVWGSTGWRTGESRSQQGPGPHGERGQGMSYSPPACHCHSFIHPVTHSNT